VYPAEPPVANVEKVTDWPTSAELLEAEGIVTQKGLPSTSGDGDPSPFALKAVTL